MKPHDHPINISAIAPKVDVDNRIPLRLYYRIADNLLNQANVYREEKNLIDLFIILQRFSSLVSETIPDHRDYLTLFPKEKRLKYINKVKDVIYEIGSLKPEVQRRVSERNSSHKGTQLGGPERISCNSVDYSVESSLSAKKQISSNPYTKQLHPAGKSTSQSSLTHRNEINQIALPKFTIEKKFQKLSFNLPPPKEETLSRHSIFGPNDLREQYLGPTNAVKLLYPSNVDLTPIENYGLNQGGQNDLASVKVGDAGGDKSAMELVLDLDDRRWRSSAEESCSNIGLGEELVQVNNIRQPSPPPVLAQLNHGYVPVPSSKVADPRPGPADSSVDGMSNFTSFQNLHIPVSMMEDFLRLAKKNTSKNLETCGILAGSLKNRTFRITTLIIPKQESKSDSCSATNEEEIFDVQDKLSLLPLGWIHTHPSQTCFMSSVDLHTHYPYQIMLPEAIAIVMAPTDNSRPYGIFHLSDPGGISVIRNCDKRGFHPHEETPDDSPIYEHCSHVYMNPNFEFKVIDLR